MRFGAEGITSARCSIASGGQISLASVFQRMRLTKHLTNSANEFAIRGVDDE
jgi:hypothetical protein